MGKFSLKDLCFGVAVGIGISMYFIVDMVEKVDLLTAENDELYNLCLEKRVDEE